METQETSAENSSDDSVTAEASGETRPTETGETELLQMPDTEGDAKLVGNNSQTTEADDPEDILGIGMGTAANGESNS